MLKRKMKRNEKVQQQFITNSIASFNHIHVTTRD